MKQWIKSLPCKIICFILCIVSLSVTASCVVGAAFMIAGEFYRLPKEYVKESVFEDMLRSESNNILRHHIGDGEYHYYSVYDYDPTITNVRYTVMSPNGETVGTNTYTDSPDFSFKWIFYKDSDGNYTEIDYYFKGAENIENADIYTVNMSVDKELSVKDQYFFYNLLIDVTYSLLYWVYPIGLLSLALSVACFIILMCSSGRRPDRDGVFPGIFNKVPIDLFLALLAGGIILLFWLIWEVWYTGEIVGAILTGILTVISVNVALGLCMSIAARIKEKTLLSNTLIWIVLKLFARFFKLLGKALSALTGAIPVIWKAVLAIICNFSIDIFLLMMAYSWDEVAFFLWSVKTALLLPFLLYGAVMLTRLEKGGKAIARGDLSYRVSTAHMIGGFKRHGNDLNSISDGMTKAVEERLKSERMKTELITNVSHDIKTPITSIINYSSLIAEEECNCEKHREYSEVLIRKSEHLKRLLSDLVEVSKASTGNLDVEPVPCDGAVLLSQVAGEFEDLCKNASLELICSYPSAPVSIMADPKKIWRVFENLMGNACKYSLPGSRVYLSLESDGAKASFIIRNTSKAPIAATADELCSRFVRGDSSRTTEGNGLGLSIAQSLTELQGGKMDVTVDGDLFKVVITFPNI